MIRIRKIKPDDISDIIDIRYKTWLKTYPNKKFGISNDDIEVFFKDRNSEQNVLSEINYVLYTDDICLCAEEGKKIVGFLYGVKSEQYNEIKSIYVLPESQGAGVGSELIKTAIDLFKKINNHKIIVHVASYNDYAIRFYIKNGFIRDNKSNVRNYFKMPISGNTIPEIEMRLN